MQISSEQIQKAARAGVALLSSSDVRVPATQLGALLLLREVLASIARGDLVVSAPARPQTTANEQQEEPPG